MSSPIPPFTPLPPSFPLTTPTSFPYNPLDFTPSDTSPASSFYTSPRFVTHIDDAAIAALSTYYSHVLPSAPGSRILDICSSWISHYPTHLVEQARNGEIWIGGVGMNEKELARNSALSAFEVRDLDLQPDISESPLLNPDVKGQGQGGRECIDASTLVVSLDYLQKPVEVLRSLLNATKDGGTLHVIISDRCFPTKAVRGWLNRDKEERVQLVGDILWMAGWKGVERGMLRDGRGGGVGGRDGMTFGEDKGGGEREGGLRGFMAAMGLSAGGTDPLWVVRGIKVREE